MRRLKFLLRPGWLVLAAVVGLFAYLCFTVLAPWQLGKNTKTEHRNDLISNSINAETVPIGDVIADSTIAPDDEWRNITAAGTYLPDADILVRLQSIEGAPSYEILTPFRLDDGRTILVNRGYVRPINGAEAPPIAVPPTDPVTLNGRVRLSEGTAPGRVPMFEDGAKQVYSIDARPIGEFIGTDLIDAYIQLEPDQPGGLGTIPLPQLDAGPYLSYGFQWLAFGIMAPLGLAYFIRAEWRERRKEKAAQAAVDGFAADDPATETTPEAPVSAPASPPAEPARTFSRRKKPEPESVPLTAQEAKLADRYGNTR
ncbi:SURF1 family protein [uncultured Rhodococcus sp.]|uniref:SURF1 family cytochrome oxidase biogenesis protein n=1 Tax=uncultured Rhodococcus sp. TaxID=194249 RepID=UPI0028DBBBDC|nr:SURF1 family protein [uncultured Rhodococcus sp.]